MQLSSEFDYILVKFATLGCSYFIQFYISYIGIIKTITPIIFWVGKMKYFIKLLPLANITSLLVGDWVRGADKRKSHLQRTLSGIWFHNLEVIRSHLYP